MSEERKYSEKEIAAIFKHASKEQDLASRNRPAGEGLSLSELQKIGEESGITQDFIARAAAALEGDNAAPASDSLFGFPLVVSKTVTLPRKLTEQEWEQLVVDLRSTYKSDGAITHEGSFRKWTSGEVSVFAEPTKSGHQVRMTTAPQKKGVVKFALGIGVAVTLVSLIFWAQVLFMGKNEWSVIAPGMVFLLSGLFPLIPLFLTPRWAKNQEEKMTGIAMRLNGQFGRAEGDVLTEKAADVKSIQTIAGDEINDVDEGHLREDVIKQHGRLRG